MTNIEFEQFVHMYGSDILRFCIMQAGDRDRGNDLYQETMLTLIKKSDKLDPGQNVRSYALSVAVMLEKKRKRKYALRSRIAGSSSFEACNEDHIEVNKDEIFPSPEQEYLRKEEIILVRKITETLEDKLKIPLILFYSADMKIREIAEMLDVPESTVKSRIRKAKDIIRKRLEENGYE